MGEEYVLSVLRGPPENSCCGTGSRQEEGCCGREKGRGKRRKKYEFLPLSLLPSISLSFLLLFLLIRSFSPFRSRGSSAAVWLTHASFFVHRSSWQIHFFSLLVVLPPSQAFAGMSGLAAKGGGGGKCATFLISNIHQTGRRGRKERPFGERGKGGTPPTPEDVFTPPEPSV